MSVPGLRQQPPVCNDKITPLTDTSSRTYQQLPSTTEPVCMVSTRRNLSPLVKDGTGTNLTQLDHLGAVLCAIASVFGTWTVPWTSNCIQSLAALFVGLVSPHSQLLLQSQNIKVLSDCGCAQNSQFHTEQRNAPFMLFFASPTIVFSHSLNCSGDESN